MRDRDIGRFGEYFAGTVLGVGMVVPFVLTLAEFDYFWIANAMYLAFVLSASSGRSSSSSPIAEASRPMGKPTRVSNQIRRLRFERRRDDAGRAGRSAIGVTRQTIIAIEQGRYSPSLEMAFQIAHAFDVTLDEVFQYRATGRSHDMTTPTTTDRGRRAPLPPRWVIRAAWTVHRAIYSLTRGRLGCAARRPSGGG